MGYTTDFTGSLSLTPVLSPEQTAYLNLLSDTRRMKRDVSKLMEIYKGKHGNPFATEKTPEAIYGREGEYFARDDGDMGQGNDKTIIDHNVPPMQGGYMTGTKDGVPGLWCQWVITDNGTTLEWNGGEKFYNYVEWLEYIIKHFFIPWGVIAKGQIKWWGEDSEDMGKIVVTDNVVKVLRAKITYK